MPINATIEFQKAERKYAEAVTISEKLRALQEMLQTAPSHKGAEHLRSDIKSKIAKLKSLQEKEKKSGKRFSYSIKKDGAAQIVLLGLPNSGKSTLLSKLTNAKPEIAPYPFTTKKPEIGTLIYDGVKLQLIEIPALTDDFVHKEKGPAMLSVVRTADLLIFVIKDKDEISFIKRELDKAAIEGKNYIIVSSKEDPNKIKEKIWTNLNIIRVFTKQPSKKPDFPPMALKKNSTILDMAKNIHKDYTSEKAWARIWGPSSKYDGQKVSLDHKLKDKDIVELHLK